MRVVTETQIRVRYGETDQMGHAYYANYFLWFEVARGEWCRDRGFTYRQLEEMGLMLPVVEAHARYRGEILYDDDIVIRIKLGEVKRAAMRFDYEIFSTRTEKVVTEGYTWHVLMGAERRAMSIPADVLQMLSRDPDEWP